MSDNADIWLWLVMVMKPNNPRLHKILADCGYNAAKAGVVIRDGRDPSLTSGEISRAKAVRLGTVREFASFCEKAGVKIVSFESENYPSLLKKIKDPPAVLFVLGNERGLNGSPILTVVGTRNASDYGKKAADYLVKPLAKAGTVIVSGMASGTDRAAHLACIEAGGRTLAFPGCGALETHPAESDDLKKRIIESGGAVISELLPDAKATTWYFKRRDAIMSGISHGTLVIEAGEKSGSLVTADCAKNQGRELFAVPPHDITSESFSGNAFLIRSGAVSACGASDIAEILKKKNIGAGFVEMFEKPVISVKSEEKSAEIPAKEAHAAKNSVNIPDDLSETEKTIVKALGESPETTESLMEKCGLDYGTAIEAVISLEMSGLISRRNDGVYFLG